MNSDKINRSEAFLTRTIFLVLPFLLSIIGISLAYKYKRIDIKAEDIAMLMTSLLLTYIATVLLNRQSRLGWYKSEIIQTDISPNQFRYTNIQVSAIFSLVIVLFIGIYFSIKSHWILFPMIVYACYIVGLNTTILNRHQTKDFLAGFFTGAAAILGTFVALTGNQNLSLKELFPPEVLLISVPPGILTSCLLYLRFLLEKKYNADDQGINPADFKKASYTYLFLILITSAIILILPILGISTYWVYISLLPFPIVIYTVISVFKNVQNEKLLWPSIKEYVYSVIMFDSLLAFSIIMNFIKR